MEEKSLKDMFFEMQVTEIFDQLTLLGHQTTPLELERFTEFMFRETTVHEYDCYCLGEMVQITEKRLFKER